MRRAMLCLLLLPTASAAPACAAWCTRDALGQSHCNHPECVSCDVCATIVECTPTKKEDLTHESCEGWCKPEHAKSHCGACSCKSCGFCRAAATPSVTTPSAAETALASPPPPAFDVTPAAAALAAALTGTSVPTTAAAPPPPPIECTPTKKEDLTHESCEVWCKPEHFKSHCVACACKSCGFCKVGTAADSSGDTPAAAQASPASDASKSAIEVISSLAATLEARNIEWNVAFKPFDRTANGRVASSDLQRVFHQNGVKPLPLHGLPSTVASVHGIDYRALLSLLPSTLPASPPPPHEQNAHLRDALFAFDTALVQMKKSWDEVFSPYERDGGLVGAADLGVIFAAHGVKSIPLHQLPSSMTTLHGIDWRELRKMLPQLPAPVEDTQP